MLREAVDEEANDNQARLLVARNMEGHLRSSATKGKTKVGLSKNRSLTTVEDCSLIDPADAEIKET